MDDPDHEPGPEPGVEPVRFLERALTLAFDSDSLVGPGGGELGAVRARAPERAGRFLILGEIARGGGGVVYRAHDPELDRDVALKVLRTGRTEPVGARERFRREVLVAGQLQHPCFVPVHDWGTLAGGEPFYVMRLVEGATLAELFREEQTAQRRLLSILEQVAQAVGYAHSRGTVHRDLKPSNVMVGAFGEVQVMDWGLAKLLGEAPSGRGAAPEPEAIMGTPAYMPPEQARGSDELVDERADVFSLGAILCRILTGVAPFQGERQTALRRARDADLGPALKALGNCGADSELIALARRSLDESIEARPRDGMEFASTLTSYFAAQEERARTAELEAEAGRVEAREERRRRRLSLSLSALALLALVTAGAGAWWWQRGARGRIEALSDEVQLAHDGALGAFARAESLGTEDLGAWELAKLEIEQAGRLLATGEVRAGLDARVRTLDADISTGHARALVLAEERERDEAMLALLDGVPIPISSNEYTASRAGYEQAFEGYGLNWEGPVPAALRARSIAPELARTFDRWALSAFLLRGDGALMEALLERSTELDPDPGRVEIRTALRARDVDGLKAMAESSDLDQLEPQTCALLAAGLRLAGALEVSEEVYKRALHTYPDDCWLNFQIGKLLLDQGKRQEEGLHFAYAALGACGDKEIARHLLADQFQRAGRYELALEHFEELARRRPEQAHYRTHIAKNLQSLGRFAPAVRAARRSAQLAPENPLALRTLATCERDWGRRRASLEAARRLYDHDRSPDGMRDLYRALWDVFEVEEARALLERTLAHEVDTVPEQDRFNVAWDWWRYGGLLEFVGELEAASEAYQTSLRFDPKRAESMCGWAHVLEEQGDLKGALEAYRRCHSVGNASGSWGNPSSDWVAFAERHVRLAERLDDFERAEYEPEGELDAYVLALAASWTGRHALATQAFAAAEARFPESAKDYRQPMIESAVARAARPDLPVKERLAHAERALDWLEATRAEVWASFEADPEASFDWTVNVLRGLELRRSFAPLRGPSELAELGALGPKGGTLVERATGFWAQVAAELEAIEAWELVHEANKG